jgi:ribosomal protein L28
MINTMQKDMNKNKKTIKEIMISKPKTKTNNKTTKRSWLVNVRPKPTTKPQKDHEYQEQNHETKPK